MPALPPVMIAVLPSNLVLEVYNVPFKYFRNNKIHVHNPGTETQIIYNSLKDYRSI